MTDGGVAPGSEKWQYRLLNMISEVLGSRINKLVNLLWKQYPKGFVAHVTKGKVPQKCKGLARYLAKYVASPPIAISCIVEYAGKKLNPPRGQ